MTLDEFFAEAKRLGCRMHLDPEDQRAAFEAKDAEIERLRAALGASCDEERSQLWEAGPGGGCGRALDAESERDKLRAALTACQEDAARMRMWGGMGWVWYSHYAATIHERCERSLGPNPSLASGEEAC